MPLKALTLPEPPAAPLPDPALFAQVCDLPAALLRRRPGDLDREVARLAEALAARLRDEADEQLTVVAAAALARVSVVTMRKWVVRYQIGSLDPRSHMFLVSRRRLGQLLAARRGS